jgi:hypothetical protein
LRVFKFTFFLLLLFTLSCGWRKNKIEADIVFDAFKEQVWPIKDTGFAGYSSLNLFLRNLGYRTAENHKPYKEILPYLDTKRTLFVVGVAQEARFTEEEVKNILDFVGRGGKLMVIAEHDNQFGSADFLRPIINAAGWEIDNGRVVVESDTFPATEGRWFWTSIPSVGEGPALLCAADLTPVREEDCKAILTSVDGKHVVAGLGKFGKGQIAIVTDSEFLWNADPDYRWEGLYPLCFSDPKTRLFIKHLIFSIIPPENESRPKDFAFPEKPKGLKRIFVYGNGGHFENYSKFLEALSGENLAVFKYVEGTKINSEDGVIVITPLSKIPQPVIDELSKSKKAALFGDMYSSLKSYTKSWSLFFKPRKIYPVPYPLNSIADKYGVRFLSSYGVNFKDNEYDNMLYVPVYFKERRLYLHRACAIELFKGKRSKDIYFKNSKETFACRVGLGLGQPVKFKDPKDIENPYFLIATDNVLAVGDSDIISDDFFPIAERIGFLEMVIEFLKSES